MCSYKRPTGCLLKYKIFASILSLPRMLMEKSSGVELELKQMDINFDQLRQSTENKIQMNLQTIANNNKQSQANAESIKR